MVLDTYFRYYIKQKDIFKQHSYARTHQDIVDIATHLTSPRDATRENIREILFTDFAAEHSKEGEQKIESTIDHATRLLLMMKVGDLAEYITFPKPLVWDQGPSLRNFVSTTFEPRNKLRQERVKLSKSFIARNLVLIGGLKIVWTDNLGDHLRMMDEDTSLAIFHHASYLQVVQHCDLFPPCLVEETIRTLALLFPPTKESQVWFKKMSETESLDVNLIKCGYLDAQDRQIDEFDYWHDRLVILKQLFDEREPTSLMDWWHDRRRGLQRYPFLLAAIALALTLLLGIVQVIEAGIQVYKAFQPTAG